MKNIFSTLKKILVSILPVLMITLTQKTRYPIVHGKDFEWSRNSLVFNIFRAYEMIFWRREGIRAESASYIDLDGTEVHDYFSLEALCVFFEQSTKNFFKKVSHPRIVKVYIPILATVGFQSPHRTQFPYLFAIAFDSVTTGGQTGGTTLTIAHTNTGSGVTICGFFSSTKGTNTDDVTAAYNSVSMTKSVSQLVIANIVVDAAFIQVIGTGDGVSHNMVFTSATSPDAMGGAIISFSGTSATQNGATGSATATNTAGGVTLTTTADNSVIFGGVFINNASESPTASGTTIQKWSQSQGSTNQFSNFGGYATTTTHGSNSIGWTNTLAAWGAVAVEIIPQASAVLSGFFIFA